MPKRKGVLGVEVEAMEKQQMGSLAEIVQLEMKVGEEGATLTQPVSGVKGSEVVTVGKVLM